MPLLGAFQGLNGADQGLDTAKEGLNGAEAGLNRTEEGLKMADKSPFALVVGPHADDKATPALRTPGSRGY
jgi:hypothetical protein